MSSVKQVLNRDKTAVIAFFDKSSIDAYASEVLTGEYTTSPWDQYSIAADSLREHANFLAVSDPEIMVHYWISLY